MTSHGRHVVSSHWSFHCLLSSLCRLTWKKNQSLHYCPFVRGVHRDPWIPLIKGIMTSSWTYSSRKSSVSAQEEFDKSAHPWYFTIILITLTSYESVPKSPITADSAACSTGCCFQWRFSMTFQWLISTTLPVKLSYDSGNHWYVNNGSGNRLGAVRQHWAISWTSADHVGWRSGPVS